MSRLPGLDLLRAIAIVWVMLFHAQGQGLGSPWSPLSQFGWMGVDLFFALSGYLIGWQVLRPLSQGRRLDFKDFYLRRALRVLPAFWTVLALYLLWPAMRERPGLESGWQFFTFTLNLLIDYERNKAFSHAWSLCVEEHFYLLFPLLAIALTRRPALWKGAATVAALVLAGIALRAWVWSDLDDNANHWVERIYYPTWMRLDGLLFGVALAALRAYRPQAWQALMQRSGWLALAGAAILALAIALSQQRLGWVASVFGFPTVSLAMALLVAAGAAEQRWTGRLRVPGAAWLAAASFSLYLVHKGAFALLAHGYGEALEARPWLAFFAYAGAALGAGALLHYGVERPFLAWRERLIRRRARSPGAGDAAAA